MIIYIQNVIIINIKIINSAAYTIEEFKHFSKEKDRKNIYMNQKQILLDYQNLDFNNNIHN